MGHKHSFCGLTRARNFIVDTCPQIPYIKNVGPILHAALCFARGSEGVSAPLRGTPRHRTLLHSMVLCLRGHIDQVLASSSRRSSSRWSPPSSWDWAPCSSSSGWEYTCDDGCKHLTSDNHAFYLLCSC